MITYYVEVNLMCMIILLLFRIQLTNMDTTSADQRILISMIWTTIAFCISDMIAGIFRGMLFPGARAIIEISNLLYFEMIAVVSYLWAVYVYYRLTPDSTVNRRFLILSALPIAAFTVIAISNPVTHILFRVNAGNLYERNTGVYLHWIVMWSYFFVPSIRVLRLYLKETSSIKKQEIQPLLFFTIAPFIASMIQMAFYGVTTTQVGITISIIMICLKSQDGQVLTDALTGINNRRGMEYFIANHMQHKAEAEYTIIMIDVDHFKQINDKYGHMAGDLVLKQIAEALKQACKSVSRRMQLSRFGGDEFIILGVDCEERELSLLNDAIAFEMKRAANVQKLPCEISVSVGNATKKCKNENEFKDLITMADHAMYDKKMKKTV